MTTIVSRTQREIGSPGVSSLALLEPALGDRTRQIAHQVQSLQNGPSPGSLPHKAIPTAAEAPLQERLFDALARVKILTSQVAMHLDQQWRRALFRQLDSLLDPAEWEEGDRPVDASSFTTFLKAILSISPDRRPGLGLSHAGHLVAAWTTDNDRLTIVFLPNDRVQWVLSRRYDGDIERFAGETGVARLAEGLAAHNPEHWFAHANQDHTAA